MDPVHPSVDLRRLERRRQTDKIILHCAATPPSSDIGADEIAKWHLARPEKFNGIGYHFVIRRDGTVEFGRPLWATGAHAKPWNYRSIGICLVGGVAEDAVTPQDNFTPQQWVSLKDLVARLRFDFPGTEIIGHRDVDGVNKACPSFEARDWARANGF